MLESGTEYELASAVAIDWPSSIWTDSVSTTSGTVFRALDLTPFTIAASGGDANLPGQSNRWGIWLQHRGSVDGQGVPNLQLTGLPIAGTGGREFRRFGIFAANAATPNLTRLGLSDAGATGPSAYDFTPSQVANWRVRLRDASGAEYELRLPAASVDADNPYIWDAGTEMRDFLEAARVNRRPVDLALYDTSIASGTQRVRNWTGRGTLTLGGETYESGKLLEVGEISSSLDYAGEGSTFVVDAALTSDRQRYLGSDPGPAPCILRRLFRKRETRKDWGPWTPVVTYRGRLSEAHYREGQLAIEIQREGDAAWRGRIRRWTGADQRRLHPEDSGLDRADRIRRSGLLTGWQA